MIRNYLLIAKLDSVSADHNEAKGDCVMRDAKIGVEPPHTFMRSGSLRTAKENKTPKKSVLPRSRRLDVTIEPDSIHSGLVHTERTNETSSCNLVDGFFHAVVDCRAHQRHA